MFDLCVEKLSILSILLALVILIFLVAIIRNIATQTIQTGLRIVDFISTNLMPNKDDIQIGKYALFLRLIYYINYCSRLGFSKSFYNQIATIYANINRQILTQF